MSDVDDEKTETKHRQKTPWLHLVIKKLDIDNKASSEKYASVKDQNYDQMTNFYRVSYLEK